MEYGATNDSRIEAQGRTDPLVWAVNKIADTKGNYLSVSYEENNPNGEYYPTRIDYTGNAEANLTPYNSVRLSYETRPDVMARHVSGSVVKMTKRLTHIQSFAGNDLVRDYRLEYEQAGVSNRSRLVSVTECNGDGDCFPATTFEGYIPLRVGFVLRSGFSPYSFLKKATSPSKIGAKAPTTNIKPLLPTLCGKYSI